MCGQSCVLRSKNTLFSRTGNFVSGFLNFLMSHHLCDSCCTAETNTLSLTSASDPDLHISKMFSKQFSSYTPTFCWCSRQKVAERMAHMDSVFEHTSFHFIPQREVGRVPTSMYYISHHVVYTASFGQPYDCPKGMACCALTKVHKGAVKEQHQISLSPCLLYSRTSLQ